MKSITVIFTPKTVNCLRYYAIDDYDTDEETLTTVARGRVLQQDETLEELAQFLLCSLVGKDRLKKYDEFYFRDDNCQNHRRYLE